MNRSLSLNVLLSSCLLTGAALAQNDECATALTLTAGTVAFDTNGATLSLPGWPCAGGGGPDLWYAYTSTVTGNVTVSTCGSTYDTALEAFSGGCAALVSIACNDDSCGLQSSITIPAVAGQVYHIRVGGWSGATGTGDLRLDDGTPTLNPANGRYYVGISSPGITWDQARQDAAAMTWQGVSGHLATLTDQAENDFVFNSLGPVNNYWIGGFQNTSSPTFSEPAGGWEWITNEPWSYTNWLPGEPNNTGGFGAEDYLELLSSTAFGQTWNDAAQQEHPAGYVVEFGGGTLGTNFCGPAVVNTTGNPGSIGASGSSTVANNSLTLLAFDLPANQFGIFITSTSQGFIPNPGGSQGNLCLGNPIGRYNAAGQVQNSGAGGNFSLALNLAQTPTPTGPVAIQAGETRHFQAWYRDFTGGGAVSNFTDGLSLTFQ